MVLLRLCGGAGGCGCGGGLQRREDGIALTFDIADGGFMRLAGEFVGDFEEGLVLEIGVGSWLAMRWLWDDEGLRRKGKRCTSRSWLSGFSLMKGRAAMVGCMV